MSGKLRLPDVTLCAADCLHPELAARALGKCMAAIDFGAAILCSDRPVAGAFQWKQIAPLRSSDDYSRFCLRDMLAYIETPFVLVVQWDGYVVNPSVWTEDFLSFDYIGAPLTAKGIVGNGGFSLRSRRLLSVLQQAPFNAGYPEDAVIYAYLRPQLEQRFGIRYAPTALAARFSYEEEPPAHPTFGFHSIRNIWHHEPEDEFLRIAAALTAGERASWQFILLAFQCIRSGRTRMAVDLYALARRDMSPDQIKAQASKGPMRPEVVSLGVDQLEKMLAGRQARPPRSS